MQIEFLGTGGAITTPKPGCECRVCAEAREKGVPYSRSGPSIFVHGPNLLIDTPEEIKDQLNRSRVKEIAACTYSHWHPDHVMGRRVWEMNKDFRSWPPQNKCTDIYLPQQVADDFHQTLGTWDHLAFMEARGMVRITEVPDGEAITLGETSVQPFRLAEDYVYAFLLEQNETTVLIAPDELHGWEPPPSLRGLDLAVIPMGVLEFDPDTGERLIHEDHSVLKHEATFRQTLDIVRKLDAARVVLTHIEEPDGLSFDDLKNLERRVSDDGPDISFAHDTLVIDV
jgi:phosphoribosyl 1,2-cyclic phosphate phosphodiesterase